MGYDMHYDDASQIMDEIAQTTPTFAGVSFDLLDKVGSGAVALQRRATRPARAIMHDGDVRARARPASSRRRTSRPPSAAPAATR